MSFEVRITLFALSGLLFGAAIIAVAVGKSLYVGFRQAGLRARRKGELVRYWVGVAEPLVIGVGLFLAGVFSP